MDAKIQIRYIGHDSWSRPVFETRKGSLLVDTNMSDAFNDREMSLCTKCNNEFDGEPDSPVDTERFEVVKDFTE